TATARATPTDTPTATPSDTPTDTPIDTATATPTATDVPTEAPSDTPTAADIPTDTPTNTPTDTPTATGTATATSTPTPTPGVWTWGENNWDQLGADTGLANNALTPAPVGLSANVVAIAAGDFHGLAVESDGSVWSWGKNTDGQLGLGSSDFSGHV